jgi:hypothetical protein
MQKGAVQCIQGPFENSPEAASLKIVLKCHGKSRASTHGPCRRVCEAASRISAAAVAPPVLLPGEGTQARTQPRRQMHEVPFSPTANSDEPPCSVAAIEVNSEPRTRVCHSVRLSVGLITRLEVATDIYSARSIVYGSLTHEHTPPSLFRHEQGGGPKRRFPDFRLEVLVYGFLASIRFLTQAEMYVFFTARNRTANK